MARSSAYGDLLESSVPKVALPSWVTNAGYGDLTKELAAADLAREQADQQWLKTIQMRDEQERQAEQRAYEEALAGRYKETQPKTMREAYEMGAEEALSRGRSKEFLLMRDKLDELDTQSAQRKKQSIKEALDVAKMNPDYAQKMLDEAGLPGSEIFSDDAKKMLRTKGTGRNMMMYDPESGEYKLVNPPSVKEKETKLVSVYNQKTGESMRVPKDSVDTLPLIWNTKRPSQEDIDKVKAAEAEAADAARDEEEGRRKAQEPNFLMRIARKIAGTEESRTPAATPTPLPERPRGDSQRAGPKVGDEVAVIKRKRSVLKD